MKKVSGYISVRPLGCYDFEFYVDDNATEEEIKQEVDDVCEYSMHYDVEEGKKFAEYWQPRILQVIEKYLGKGRRIKDVTRDQVEAIDLIVTDLKDMVKYKEV